jgi:hypothetical protein
LYTFEKELNEDESITEEEVVVTVPKKKKPKLTLKRNRRGFWKDSLD